MKLISLKLYDDFRSLKSGFVIDFLSDFDKQDFDIFDPYCIVGRNGSGKSNILEVLSSIFYHLEIEYLNFLPRKAVLNSDGDGIEYEEMEEFQSQTTSPNAYRLEYYISQSFDDIKYQHVTIEKKHDKKANIYIDKDHENSLNALDAKEYLPKYIVGYSSGENEILSLQFLRMRMIQYEEYISYLKQDISYTAIESRMVYLDDTFSQAIFISNFLFPDEKIHKIFDETIGVKNVKEFRIVINTDKVITDLLDKEYSLYTGVSKKIDELKACATLYHDDEENDQLILDFYVDEACRKAFKWFFRTRLELFKFFQLLIAMNYYRIKEETRVKLYTTTSPYAKGFVPEPSWDDRFFTFKNFMIKKDNVEELVLTRMLSDGEHQFLHSIGLALLYKNTSSLFLLDEPETHFNPEWRAKYISTLKKCFDGDSVSPEVLLSSHSPFIVSDSKKEKVLVFKKDEDNKVTCNRPEINTFGASVNQITMAIFEQTDTIGDYANGKLTELVKRFEKGESKEVLIRAADQLLGDSVEKVLFINNLLDKKR